VKEEVGRGVGKVIRAMRARRKMRVIRENVVND